MSICQIGNDVPTCRAAQVERLDCQNPLSESVASLYYDLLLFLVSWRVYSVKDGFDECWFKSRLE